MGSRANMPFAISQKSRFLPPIGNIASLVWRCTIARTRERSPTAPCPCTRRSHGQVNNPTVTEALAARDGTSCPRLLSIGLLTATSPPNVVDGPEARHTAMNGYAKLPIRKSGGAVLVPFKRRSRSAQDSNRSNHQEPERKYAQARNGLQRKSWQ